MLAAAAMLAVHPERINKIFENKSYSQSGLFMITFYERGEPKRVVVDDRLPLYPNPNGRYVDQMFNAKMSPNGAWWGPILEKAYCKMYVNCANTNSGTPLQSLRDLTGYPVLKYELSDQNDDDVFNSIKNAVGRKWPIVTSCTVSNYGLQSAHAYGIMDGVTLGSTKLIKVRNPWGKEKYTGAWNDHDSRWTDAYKRQVNLQPGDDGIFYMPFNIYRASFTTYYVNMY